MRPVAYCDACGVRLPHPRRVCAFERELDAAQARLERVLTSAPPREPTPVTMYCERCGYWVDAAHDCPALRPTVPAPEPSPVVAEVPLPRGDAHTASVATRSPGEECVSR